MICSRTAVECILQSRVCVNTCGSEWLMRVEGQFDKTTDVKRASRCLKPPTYMCSSSAARSPACRLQRRRPRALLLHPNAAPVSLNVHI